MKTYYTISIDVIMSYLNLTKLILRSFCSGDCGMFTIKAAEFLVHYSPLTNLKQDDMRMFRQKLCIELYKHGALKNASPNVDSDSENNI